MRVPTLGDLSWNAPIGNQLVKINEGASLVYLAYPVSLLSVGIGDETCKLSSLPLKKRKKS